jgi:hypothetical protein
MSVGDGLRRLLCGEEEPTIPTPEPANESDFQKAIHAAYIEVHKGKIDRTAAAATFVTTAAGAIGTLYTGLLALAFSVEATPAKPLPARGLVPAIFLALAFFFSVLRIGFVKRSGTHTHILGPAETWEGQELRLLQFMYWVDRGALARAWSLRISVVCLGAAVALLPLPFLSLSTWAAAVFIGVVTAVVALYIAFELTPPIRAGLAQRRAHQGV